MVDGPLSRASACDKLTSAKADSFLPARLESIVARTSFKRNHLYGHSGPFPLGFRLLADGPSVWVAYLHAQSIEEIADILVRHAKEWLCVFEVAHYCYDMQKRQVALEEIAKDSGLSPMVPDTDVILIKNSELRTLLSGFSHYNLLLLDFAEGTREITALEGALRAVDTPQSLAERILDHVERSSVFISSHDDCYIYVETRSRDHVISYARRLLRSYVAAIMGFEVSDPPASLIESYLACHSTLTVPEAGTISSDGTLKLPCSAEPFAFGETMAYPTVATISYSPGLGTWELTLSR